MKFFFLFRRISNALSVPVHILLICSLMSSNGMNFSPHPSSKILLNNNNLCIDTVNEKTLKHKKSEKNLSLFSQDLS